MRRTLGIDPSVMPNGVTGIPARKRTFEKPLVFETALRIAPDKRVYDLIEVFNKHPVKFLIAGKVEPDEEEYAQQLRTISGRNIRWSGEQDTDPHSARLGVFVMISEPAGCLNASLEAMASGHPIIATNEGRPILTNERQSKRLCYK